MFLILTAVWYSMKRVGADEDVAGIVGLGAFFVGMFEVCWWLHAAYSYLGRTL